VSRAGEEAAAADGDGDGWQRSRKLGETSLIDPLV